MTGGDALVRLERAGNLIFDIPDDLETVVDSVALERFVMLGMLGGAAVSIASRPNIRIEYQNSLFTAAMLRATIKGARGREAEEAKALLQVRHRGEGASRSSPCYPDR